MSEEEIIKILTAYLLANIPDIITQEEFDEVKQAIQGLLDLYNEQQKEIEELKKGNKSLMDSRKKWKDRYYKEKEKNKQNENIGKVLKVMSHNIPNNVEIVCMIRDDFERNFGSDYISKDRIREFIEKNRKEFGSRYNLLDYDDITYEYWIKADKLIKLLEE